MAQAPADWNFRFLYRQGEGCIGRRQWWLASAPPTVVAVALTLIWIAIAPPARDLAHEQLFIGGVAARYAYLIVYSFVLLLSAVMQYFVSAKRFSARELPSSLAGVLPFAIFVAAAANWYQPRSEGAEPAWISWLFDLAALAAVGWTIYELGLAKDRDRAIEKEAGAPVAKP
jgi:uncharacterized membrane protein YhaH (DUF805 family)